MKLAASLFASVITVCGVAQADEFAGTTRWTTAKHPTLMCPELNQFAGCKTSRPGTELKILQQVTVERYGTKIPNGYQVKDAKGIVWYVDSTAPIFMADEQARVRARSEAASCKKKGGVSIGMTGEQVRASCWGRPSRVNETINTHGKHEQWIYGNSYVYLDNGVVTSIQQSR